jgi:hypothetical protein
MAENQDWMERIEQEFESQTSEQIDKLLNQCKFYFEDDDMIINIIRNIRRTKNISFKQWKALKAQLSKTNNPKKTI